MTERQSDGETEGGGDGVKERGIIRGGDVEGEGDLEEEPITSTRSHALPTGSLGGGGEGGEGWRGLKWRHLVEVGQRATSMTSTAASMRLRSYEGGSGGVRVSATTGLGLGCCVMVHRALEAIPP